MAVSFGNTFMVAVEKAVVKAIKKTREPPSYMYIRILFAPKLKLLQLILSSSWLGFSTSTE